MSKKRKAVVLTGDKKRLACVCPACGHKKTLEYRRAPGRKRKIYGVSEVQ